MGSSLFELFKNHPVLAQSLMSFAQTGDKDAYRSAVIDAAQAGNVGEELLLGEQYITEQCTFEPNQDLPHCGMPRLPPPAKVSTRCGDRNSAP